MKGNPKVLQELNKALREELTAINQYFVHAEMCENWGYHRLSGYIKKQSIGEMKHAEALLERILFLEGVPAMEPLKLTLGDTVKQMIEHDLKLELSVVEQLGGHSFRELSVDRLYCGRYFVLIRDCRLLKIRSGKL